MRFEKKVNDRAVWMIVGELLNKSITNQTSFGDRLKYYLHLFATFIKFCNRRSTISVTIVQLCKSYLLIQLLTDHHKLASLVTY